MLIPVKPWVMLLLGGIYKVWEGLQVRHQVAEI